MEQQQHSDNKEAYIPSLKQQCIEKVAGLMHDDHQTMKMLSKQTLPGYSERENWALPKALEILPTELKMMIILHYTDERDTTRRRWCYYPKVTCKRTKYVIRKSELHANNKKATHYRDGTVVFYNEQ